MIEKKSTAFKAKFHENLLAYCEPGIPDSLNCHRPGRKLKYRFFPGISEFTAELKLIKDKASAEEQLPKLKAIENKLAENTKAPPKLSPGEQKKLLESRQAIQTEMSRLERIPEVRALLIKQLLFFQAHVKSNKLAAEAQIRNISNAIKFYHIQNEKYPENLNVLIEGDKPYYKPSATAFIDPWNKPLQYDPKGPKHNGKMPDVWTVSPDDEVLGNWEE